MRNKNEKQGTAGEAKAKPEVIKLGLDLHARQVTECRQLDGSTPKPAQQWCAAPRFFVGTGQVQRRIISWEVARGVRGNLTMGEP
jgi:hypothetical protein